MAKKINDQEEAFIEAKATETDRVKPVDISEKMKTAFLNYSMSVIVARALPDIRDGLKPVQRRIIYGMNALHIYPGTPFKKSARITGEVMGKYHPHGDSSIYEAMVRMAQPFSYRYPLVDGHGNFGNIDGDGAAASRYTEARMSKISAEMVRDLDKDTVNFVDNYDGEEQEPVILPARVPNLLINGSTGIAVGMATNIPPHNIGEAIDGCLAVMDNSEITTEELMQYVKGPDFPTGGMILGLEQLKQAYETGRGTITIRSKARIDELANGKTEIVVTEIPYEVNKTRLIERIAELVKDKVVDGITDLRDESSLANGVKIVIELRKDVNAPVMLNTLYKYTQLQTSYGINMICLVNGAPKCVSLKEMLEEYLKFQVEIITRRTAYDLKKTKEREHILKGLVIALQNVDAVIATIKSASDTQDAINKLMTGYNLDEIQAREILNIRLQRLTHMAVEQLEAEEAEAVKTIAYCEEVLASEDKKKEIIKTELLEMKDKYADKRVSEISAERLDIDNEDLIPVEDILITVTNNGYAKRIPVAEYSAQNRGGKGLIGMKTHEDDAINMIVPSSTHDWVLFFSDNGKVYKIKGYEVQAGTRISKGQPLVNLLECDKSEKISGICPIKDFDDDSQYLLFVTKQGIVKRTNVTLFKNIRRTGIIAINLNEGDSLLSVMVTDGKNDIILGASNGKAIRFPESDMRDISRTAIGVRGMKLAEGEELVGVGLVRSDEDKVLVLSEKGFGKKSLASEYRCQNRGGQGVKTLNITEKNGKLKALRVVSDEEDIIATTNKGMIIRTHISGISQTGRNAMGVIVMRLEKNQKLQQLAIVPHEDDEEEIVELPELESEKALNEAISTTTEVVENVENTVEETIEVTE